MKAQFIVLTALALSACASFGPDRKPPQVSQPHHYAAEAQPDQLPKADGKAQKIAAGARPVPEWWQAYDSEALNQLVEEGLKNSPSLASAQDALKAAREQLRAQVGKTAYPSVDATLAPARARNPGVTNIPGIAQNIPEHAFQSNIFVADVSATYDFDIFGAIRLANRALAGHVDQQAYELESTRRALAANIVTATINAAALQAEVTATEQLVELGEQRARDTAARYRLGSASHDEMLTAEEQAANAAATLPPLRAQLLSVRHAQAVLLGRTPDQAPAALALDSLHLPESLPVSVPSDLLHQRPDILAAEAAVRAAADQAGSAAAAMYPSLVLYSDYGRGGYDWSKLSSPSSAIWSVGGALTQPLFHGGALKAHKREAAASYEAAVSQYKQTVLSAFRNVADTLVSLEEDAKALAQAQRAETAARESKTDSESRYKLGALPVETTLTTGEQYESAYVHYVRARAGRLADTAALLDAMGDPQIAKTAKATSGR
jgi:NodT family efflux transporter outer membrane factor (OMF) lipoprotein